MSTTTSAFFPDAPVFTASSPWRSLRSPPTAIAGPFIHHTIQGTSFFFNTSWTILGLAFPRLSFITCPTKKERSPAFPAR